MSLQKILLVDDSKSARYALRLQLQKHNLDVDTADSAEAALKMVKEVTPDAIFMDHLMPGMNGFEAVEALKSDPATADIPVVMCTSNDEESYLRQAREKGALDILPKPTTPDKLNTVLEEIKSAIEERKPAAAESEIIPEPAILEQEMETLRLTEEATAPVPENLEVLVGNILDDRLAEFPERITRDILDNAETGLTKHLDAEVARLRNDLLKIETEHVQAVANKLSRQVLPDVIRKQLEKEMGRVNEDVATQMETLSARISKDLLKQPEVVREVMETAEAAAENRAADVAVDQAREVAETVAAEKARHVAETLTRSARQALQRMYLLAGMAASVGILAAVGVYFFLR